MKHDRCSGHQMSLFGNIIFAYVSLVSLCALLDIKGEKLRNFHTKKIFAIISKTLSMTSHTGTFILPAATDSEPSRPTENPTTSSSSSSF